MVSWLRDAHREIVRKDGKPVLQFIAIQRKDTNELAIPGVRKLVVFHNTLTLLKLQRNDLLFTLEVHSGPSYVHILKSF